ncbi:MAG: ABC transporter substrate-binding protein [Hyphomicrobiaceae bacterium]
MRSRSECFGGCRNAACRGLSQIQTFLVLATGAISTAVWVLMLHASTALAVEKAEAASGPPLSVAIFVSSRNDQCYDDGRVAAIKRLTIAEQQRINASGGVHGRPLDIKFLDDARDEKKSVANMRSALGDPTQLAMIGLAGSSRGKAVFDAVGAEIGASKIPFLADLSVSNLFNGHANVYSTRPSQDEVRAPVMVEFTRTIGYLRPAFLGRAGSVFADALGDAIKKLQGAGDLTGDVRIENDGEKITPQAISKAIEALKPNSPDLLYVAIGASAMPELMKALQSAGLTPAIFMTGRINALPEDVTRSYPNAIYQLAWDDLPEVYNNRVRKRISTSNPTQWVFEGTKVSTAPGWAKGECKERNADLPPDPLSAENLRAIGMGAQYADMVGLVATAARQAPRGTDIMGLRAAIVKRLETDYATGNGAYKGSFENWSFDQSTRTATRMPFVVILPQGLGRTQLAPLQFVRARDGSLRQTQTLYLDIDMIKAHRIDENEQSFFAEFYLSLRADNGGSLDHIEFANAYIDPVSSRRQLTIETIHGGGASNAYPATMKIYKVSGRFLFSPQLENYPLDTQLFSIELQPKSGDAPFIVQPPPLELRDHNMITDGWDPVAQYVGTDEDFVPVVDAFTHTPSVVPFYKASFSWLMKRQTTDYILRVVVPLGFILIVAYLSIFIPRSNFEAIVTIQVTALLSAVALYLALPALESDSATLSDRMFVFVYMMVAVMIAISILRVNQYVATRKWMIWSLDTIHVVVLPILVAVATLAVYGMSMNVQ